MVTLQFAPASIHTDYSDIFKPTTKKFKQRWFKEVVVSASDPSLEMRVYEPDRTKNFLEADALKRLYEDKMQPLNAPQSIDLRLAANPTDYIFTKLLNTATITAIGKTRGGKLVYVVAHGGHPMTSPKWLRQAMPGENYHVPAKLRDQEFWALLDREDGRPFSEEKDVYVLSEAEMEYEPSGVNIPEPERRKLLTAFAKGEKRKLLWITKTNQVCKGGRAIEIHHRWRNGLVDDTTKGANLATFLKLNGSIYGDPVFSDGFDAGHYNSTPGFVGFKGGVPLSSLSDMVQSTPQVKELALEAMMSRLSSFVQKEDVGLAKQALELLYR